MISQRYSETPTLHVFFSDIRLFPFQFVVEVSFFSPLESDDICICTYSNLNLVINLCLQMISENYCASIKQKYCCASFNACVVQFIRMEPRSFGSNQIGVDFGYWRRWLLCVLGRDTIPSSFSASAQSSADLINWLPLFHQLKCFQFAQFHIWPWYLLQLLIHPTTVLHITVFIIVFLFVSSFFVLFFKPLSFMHINVLVIIESQP